MEQYTQITIDMWLSWKEDIRRKLAETAGNFVYIGYRLKQIRNSGMFDGAEDIFEFAKNEYGLGKSTVSRFIAINEKFSEGGDSLELKKEYAGISSSKLSEMLTLTEEECRMITEKTTVKDIRELKRFDAMQPPEEEKETDLSPMEKALLAYFADKKDMVEQLLLLALTIEGAKKAAELINPGEYTTIQKGMCFLFLYNLELGIKYKEMGSPTPVNMGWISFLETIQTLYREKVEDFAACFAKKAEETPKKQENLVATSQQGTKSPASLNLTRENEKTKEENSRPEKPQEKEEKTDTKTPEESILTREEEKTIEAEAGSEKEAEKAPEEEEIRQQAAGTEEKEDTKAPEEGILTCEREKTITAEEKERIEHHVNGIISAIDLNNLNLALREAERAAELIRRLMEE